MIIIVFSNILSKTLHIAIVKPTDFSRKSLLAQTAYPWTKVHLEQTGFYFSSKLILFNLFPFRDTLFILTPSENTTLQGIPNRDPRIPNGIYFRFSAIQCLFGTRLLPQIYIPVHIFCLAGTHDLMTFHEYTCHVTQP